MFVAQLRTVRLGVKSLMLHKLRSTLTTLGILFGVASVIGMLAVGEGTAYEAQQRIKALGSTNILIRSKKPAATEQNTTQNSMSAQTYGLKNEDAERFRVILPAVTTVVPVREATKEVRAGARAMMQASILGTTPEYTEIVRMGIAEGRWLSDEDDRRRANVAVLGASACASLFPLENPIGQTIRIASDRFTVVGVLERLGRIGASSGPSVDEAILIPIQVWRDWFGEVTIERSGGSMKIEAVELHEIRMRVREPEDVLATAGVLRDMLAKAHDKGDYELTVPLELLREAEETKFLWNLVLGTIAGISLLVGGIGIMNVMLATVTERTREIGIRRALGAKRRNIVSQFLVETVVLSVTGGLLGVAIGLGVPVLIEHWFPKIKTILKPEHSVLAFSISAAVGVVSGLYPAVRAASMDPVEALRRE